MNITLKTYDGIHFLSAEAGGGRSLVATASRAAEWETFELVGPLVAGARIALRTYDKEHYVCASGGGGSGIEVNRTEAREWESFLIVPEVPRPDGTPIATGEKIGLQSYNGHWLCAERGGGANVVANRTVRAQWETFIVQIVATASAPVSTRIIHISDLHFSTSEVTWDITWPSPGHPLPSLTDRMHSYAKRAILEDYLIRNAPLLGSNTVVITGDITDSGDDGDYAIAREFLTVLRNAGMTVYVSPGNHDYFKEGNCVPFTGDRRGKFAQLVGYSNHPHVVDTPTCKLIILDSLQSHTTFAQGHLGDTQIMALGRELAISEAARKAGKKVVVCLHHSPFDLVCDASLESAGGLIDGQRLLETVGHRVDALLFGHTGNVEQSYPDQEGMYGIPIIHSENLEHEDAGIHVALIDVGANRVETFTTSLQKFPIVRRGTVPDHSQFTPVVSRSSASYDYIDAGPAIRFQSYDTVTISVRGGVQTGGSGNTWKRFVNPSGDGSDHKYYGLIHVPGITGGLTPIRDLVTTYGRYDSPGSDACVLRFKLPVLDDIQPTARVLKVGYTDDNYGDNGFWKPDEGTEQQCKSVGAARINIQIEHGSSSGTTLVFSILPVVNSPTPVVYDGICAAPQIGFLPGDRVTIEVGGGVQTGGSGKSWKRYVNPSGDGANSRYFGQINLPGITSGLTAIRDLVNPLGGSYDPVYPDRCKFTVKIPPIGSGLRYLSLHYVDDDYSDNGYWGHDDGNGDQCKNVGNAFVRVTIQRA